MSSGDPVVYYTTTAAATTAASSINLPMNYQGHNGYINQNQYTFQPATTAGPPINMGGGIMTRDNTGYLTWNGDPLATYKSNKEGITTINEMLKDEMMREIILCKTREDCKEQYGSYGLKMFDSMMN